MAKDNIENKDKEKKAPKTVKTEKTAKSEVKEEKKPAKKTVKKTPAADKAPVADKSPAEKKPTVRVEKKPGADAEKKPAESIKPSPEVKAQADAKVSAGAQTAQKSGAKAAGKKAESGQKGTPATKRASRLKAFYEHDVVKALNELYKYKTPMAIPKVIKVIINMGIGEGTQDKAVVDSAIEELTTIAAQKAVKTFAKKSISNFHLREGMPIGARVTLRGNRMYDFIDKLISVALPRVRDFKGLSSSSFDGRGNYTIGLKEQLVFPEIDYDKISKVRGMNLTIVTNAPNDDEAYQLLKTMGFPFKEK